MDGCAGRSSAQRLDHPGRRHGGARRQQLGEAAVTLAAADLHLEAADPARADEQRLPGLAQAGGLGDHHRVRLHRPRRRERLGAPHAARLLVGGEREHQPAARVRGAAPARGGEQQRSDGPLHVGAAQPVGDVAVDGQVERIGLPGGTRVADRLRVQMATQRQCRARPGVQLDDDVRAAGVHLHHACREADSPATARTSRAICASPAPGFCESTATRRAVRSTTSTR